jgi:3-oxoacyl-[acyl-carrier protein] reductase
MTKRLQGKKALITGGTRGMGAEIARKYAAEGADVIITYANSEDKARAMVKELEGAGVKAHAIKADAQDSKNVRNAVKQAIKEFGHLDILVNNAGIGNFGLAQDLTDEEFDSFINVNIKALHVAMQEFIKAAPKGSVIINFGSVLGERIPMPGIATYSMTKFAVAGLTRGWARDLAPLGIRVNTIQPGPIDTDMNPANGEGADGQAAMTAMGRYGTAKEIANVAAFLASDEASYITGEQINVDGGFRA